MQTGREIAYIAAPPRMQLYIDYSARIYAIYLQYISEEDIHVYSIDEVFMDLTHYLSTNRNKNGQPITARELAKMIIQDVWATTGIPVTAGIGNNAIFKGMNLQEGATTMERNLQIGGHKA